MTRPRIALLGFSIECNRFAPVATKRDFAARTLLGGDVMLAEPARPAPCMLGETARLSRRDGRGGPLGPGAQPAGDGGAERPGGAGVFRPPDAAMGSRPARRRDAGRCLLRAARRRPDDRRSRPRGHPARAGPPHRRPRRASGRHLRSACQRLGRRRRRSSTASSATAPIRISTCANAAPKRPDAAPAAGRARAPSSHACVCPSCRRR